VIKPDHLREYIVKPVLSALSEFDVRLGTEASVELLMGTAAQESSLGYHLNQLGGGPGAGIYSIEEGTEQDVWRYLRRKKNKGLRDIVKSFSSQTGPEALRGNFYYSTAIARIKYWMIPDALPQEMHLQALYWKAYYNTEKGKGTSQEYVKNYEKLVQ